MPDVAQHVSLSYQEGTSDKVYHVHLVPWGQPSTARWQVYAEYGRRGGRLTTVDKSPVGGLSWQEGKFLFDSLVAEKMNKGYHPTTPTPQHQLDRLLEGLRWVTTGQPARADDP